MSSRKIFMTGGTGYVGRHLIPRLAERGHDIRALVRKGSERKLPANCEAVFGDALNKATFAEKVKPAGTFIQLVGVAHPSPAKGKEFRSIDLVSARASIAAAVENGIQHFVYVSVAQPAPMMKEYQAVRAEGEALLRASGMNATILRPWYILGPGHRWPWFLVPAYWICERLPATRDSAQRLGLVTLKQMLTALVEAVGNPPRGIRVVEVPEIRRIAHRSTAAP
jgi:uncharacterized protein YbjT (DUF2867 family)